MIVNHLGHKCASGALSCVFFNYIAWKRNHNTPRKDTDDGGGEDGENGSDGDGALGVFQIARPVRASHDS